MLRGSGRESTLAFIVTTFALALIALAFASASTLGSSRSDTSAQAAASAPDEPAALKPIGSESLQPVAMSGSAEARLAAESARGGSRVPDPLPAEETVSQARSDVLLSPPVPAAEPASTPEEEVTAPEVVPEPDQEEAADPPPAAQAEASGEQADSPAEQGSTEPAGEASSAPEPSPEPATPPAPEPETEPEAVALTAETEPIKLTARVGIQAGHWDCEKLPAELASLRRSTGAAGKGWTERGINLQIAQNVVARLEQLGVEVDLIPATVPPGYQADAFVSLHGDANSNSGLSGFKAARASWSAIPERDDALVNALRAEYGAGTGLSEHRGTITQNMLRYYAFNYRQLDHAVAPTTPAAILETGFLTNKHDLKLLTEEQDRVAEAIVNGIVRFLQSR